MSATARGFAPKRRMNGIKAHSPENNFVESNEHHQVALPQTLASHGERSRASAIAAMSAVAGTSNDPLWDGSISSARQTPSRVSATLCIVVERASHGQAIVAVAGGTASYRISPNMRTNARA